MILKLEKRVLLISAATAVLALILVGVFLGYKKTQALSASKTANKAINYIQQNFNISPELIDSTKEKGAYKIRFRIGENEYTAFISKDGRYLFPEGYDMDATTTQEQQVGAEEE